MKKRLLTKIAAALLACTTLGAVLPAGVGASASSDPLIVVSLGDSYSAGEGIPAFYGQEKPWEQRVYDEDWLAHRSKKSWPGLLSFSGVSGTMNSYNVRERNAANCKWYFAAASGAETKHISKQTQEKKTSKRVSLFKTMKTTYQLPKQIDVFNKVSGDVDYVTMTIGGNDVGFADIITTCATGSTYLHFGSGKLKLEKEIDRIWEQFGTTRANIKRVYKDVEARAGQQAEIIVAGYPKLLDKEGKGVLISEKEATIVNQNVTKFNNRIADIVNECKSEGMQIHFVDVEAEFDQGGGHQAYSDDAWINSIILTKQDQDLEQTGFVSAYSIHPNENGAKAYARCVNAKIREIENSRMLRNTVMRAAPAALSDDLPEETLPETEAIVTIVDVDPDAAEVTTVTESTQEPAETAAEPAETAAEPAETDAAETEQSAAEETAES